MLDITISLINFFTIILDMIKFEPIALAPSINL